MPKPTLLYVHNSAIGDALANQVQTLEMCRALQLSGLEVTLLIPEGKLTRSQVADEILNELGEPPAFKIDFWKIKQIPGLPRTLKHLFSLRNQKHLLAGFDYLFIRYAPFLPIAVNVDTKLIFESHSTSTFTRYRILNKFASSWIAKQINKNAIFVFVAISQALSNYWVDRGVGESRILVLHDGVRENTIATKIEKQVAKTNLKITTESKVVVYAGTVKPDRHPQRIIQLAKDIPETTFYVVGGTSQQLQQSSTPLPSNVICVGRVPHSEVPMYLAAADAVLMLWSWDVPTIHHCSPLKVFEYMAAERTIVGESFPTITEILEDRVSALLVEPNRYELLRDAVIEATSDVNTDYAQNSHRLVSQYTWEQRATSIRSALKTE